jgi:tRNA dimethylallyltransferase
MRRRPPDRIRRPPGTRSSSGAEAAYASRAEQERHHISRNPSETINSDRRGHRESITTAPRALIVAGPTASGKSALALDLAERLRGSIINTDAMQVYRELRILTARPTAGQTARVPHVLYGVRPAAEPGSVAWWRAAALTEMTAARDAGRMPILTGGSGLYFAALTEGLADIPEPGPAARAEARALLQQIGPAALHARLADADPTTAARLRPTDSQRIARAWEVWRGTGTGLAAWQARKARPAPWRFAAILLDPPRAALRAAIAVRLRAMLREGALEEVRALLALQLDTALPAMRAHGVPEISAHLRGEITLQEAGRRIELVTGQYARRQATWFRHHRLADSAHSHMIHARFTCSEQFPERTYPRLVSFLETMT